MSLPSRLAAMTLAAAALAPAAPAAAAWFPSEPVDGPSPDILALGGVDVARDGTGAVAYVKSVGGVPHVFVSRLVAGVWRAPEQVDLGLAGAASSPVVAAGTGYRVVVAWVTDGTLHGAVAEEGEAPAPFTAPVPLATGARDPHIDIGVNQTAYVAFAAGGAGGSDVRAARVQGTRWEVVPAALDIEDARAAGDGDGRPRVAVAADGNALVVWGEDHADGRRRVYGRRVIGLRHSQVPQEVSLPELNGTAGGAAGSPDVSTEYDGSYAWVVWRQDFGASRALARRLVGSQYEAPSLLEATGGADPPRVAIDGRGHGVMATGLPGGQVAGTQIHNDLLLAPGARWDADGGAGPALPVVTASDNGMAATAWFDVADDGSVAVIGRHREGAEPRQAPPAFEEQTVLSQPGFGPAGPDGRLEAASDRTGDTAVAFLQGGPVDRRLVVASYDRPPSAPFGITSERPRSDSTPELKWRKGTDLWGELTFKVFVDGAEVASTSEDVLTVPQPLADGRHSWKVVAVDRRGQTRESRERTLRIDATAPRLRVKVRGARRAGALIRLSIRARDGRGGVGVASVRTSFGDRTRRVRSRRPRHRYARPGRYRIVVRAADRLGNVARRTVRLRIRR